MSHLGKVFGTCDGNVQYIHITKDPIINGKDWYWYVMSVSDVACGTFYPTSSP